MTPAWERRLRFALLVAGIATLIGFVALSLAHDEFAVDFGEGLYPQAKGLVERGEAFEPRGTPIDGQNTTYTILTTLVAAPLTFVPSEAARWIATVASVGLLLGALAVLGVRDTRVYGIALMWPPVLSAVQTAQVTPVLAFLLALAFRHRDRAVVPGVAVGLAAAAKLFLIPAGAWIVALRRLRPFVALVVTGVAAGLLLILPYASPFDYLDIARRNADVLGERALSLYVLLGADELARAVTICAGLAVAVLAAAVERRRSLPLAVAACIVLSPIVWQHYYALLLVPLAALRPRFGPLWVLPLGYWAVPFGGAADWQIAVALGLLAAITATLAIRPGPDAHPVPALG